MIKKLFKNKFFQTGFTAFAVIAASILFYFIIRDLGDIFAFIGGIIKILTPLIVGLVLAYIMNPIVKLFEKKFFVKIKSDVAKRNLSIACTIIIIIGLLSALISIIIPQLLLSIQTLIVNIPTYVVNLENIIKDWLSNSELKDSVLNNYDSISKYVIDAVNNVLLPSTNSAISKISSGVLGFVSAIFNIAIGTVFAVYILANTKNFSSGIRKILYSLFDIEKVNNFINEVEHVNHVFSQFMIGKICDSFGFVFVMTFLFLAIFKFPYPLLIAVIIAITDLIPYFGPYIGSVPSAFLIALVSPVRALIFVAFMVVLQQIDGNFVTPKIQHEATGLPSFWVLFAITFFGGLFGVVGMIIGVPCFTIIYEIISDLVNKNLRKKSMPTNKDFYEQNVSSNEKIVKSRLLEKLLKDTSK